MNIETLVRKNILSLKPYVAARHSHSSGILLDANENSFGSTYEDSQNLDLNRYPDPYQKELRIALSTLINIPSDHLFFGVGSDEIIDLLIRIFCEPVKDNIIICEPTYGMYRVCGDINNVEVVNVPLNNEYDIDEEKLLSSAKENTKVIFLCSPNNPTANLLSKQKILNIAEKSNCVVVVDEAYIDFADEPGLHIEAAKLENLVVIRTFSKAWGLAGVRCGYSIASKFITELLFRVKAPYNMNKLTSNAVINAIKNKSKRDSFVDLIKKEKNRVEINLKSNKNILSVAKSDANFISFKVDRPKEVFTYLENNGIIIRDRSNQLNFSGYLRVTIGTIEENNFFLIKLNEILK